MTALSDLKTNLRRFSKGTRLKIGSCDAVRPS